MNNLKIALTFLFLFTSFIVFGQVDFAPVNVIADIYTSGSYAP
ncbi:MAG: hypothetical protein ACI94Y_002061 [Maribacter sp.]|jgi:hypothetical protein